VKEILSEVLGVVIPSIATLLVGLLTTVASKYLGVKVKVSREEGIKESITSLIKDSVVCVYQTYVDTLKKKGEFKRGDALLAYSKARSLVEANLSSSMRKYIVSKYKDLESYLNIEIEKEVSNLKESLK
jgi:hypothetical protein